MLLVVYYSNFDTWRKENALFYRQLLDWLASVILVVILNFRSSVINMLAISKVIHVIHWVLIALLSAQLKVPWFSSSAYIGRIQEEQWTQSQEQN